MSQRARDWSVTVPDLTPDEAFVLFAIADAYFDDAGESRISLAGIARITRHRENSVSVILQRLERNGIVEVIRKEGQRNRIYLPTLATPPPGRGVDAVDPPARKGGNPPARKGGSEGGPPRQEGGTPPPGRGASSQTHIASSSRGASKRGRIRCRDDIPEWVNGWKARVVFDDIVEAFEQPPGRWPELPRIVVDLLQEHRHPKAIVAVARRLRERGKVSEMRSANYFATVVRSEVPPEPDGEAAP